MAEFEIPVPDKSIILLHQLVFQINKRINRALREKSQLNMPQFMMLMTIKLGKLQNPSKIAEEHDVSPAVISRQMRTLAKKKLIKFEYNPFSLREKLITITEEGQKEIDSVIKLLNEDIDMPESQLDAEQHQNFIEILETLTNYYCAK